MEPNAEYASNIETRVFKVHEHSLENSHEVVYVLDKARILEIIRGYSLASNQWKRINIHKWRVVTPSGAYLKPSDWIDRIPQGISDIVITDKQPEQVQQTPEKIQQPEAIHITVPSSDSACTVNVSYNRKRYTVDMPSRLCVRDIGFIIGIDDPFNASFVSLTSHKVVDESVLVSEIHEDLAVD